MGFEKYLLNEVLEKEKDIIQKGIKAPFVKVNISTLGGEERASVMISLSLDDQKDWANKIFQNSRYAQISWDHNQTLEMFSGDYRLKNMRKGKAKTAQDVVKKINQWIDKVS